MQIRLNWIVLPLSDGPLARMRGLQTFGSVFTTTQMQLLLRCRLSLAAHSVLQQPGLRSLQALGIDATDSIINATYCALIPMRRSVRDAIVGFTVIGGIVSFAAMAMWVDAGCSVGIQPLDRDGQL